MATIRIPTPMRRYTNGERLVTVTADTVATAIDELDRRYPGVRERLVDGEGQIHRFVTVFVGEEDVRLLQGLATPLDERAEVSIIPAMAGGGLSAGETHRPRRVAVPGGSRLATA